MKKLILVLIFAVIANAQRYKYKAAKHEGFADNLDWWEHGVFYQIYPSSFRDSNADGRGDLRGIIDNLEHLVDLGVTGAWINPIFKSPMIDGGYDIEDFRAVNELFGTEAELVELFQKAKDLGLKIILDFVPNHTSDQHEWFTLSAARAVGYEDFYIWRDCPDRGDGIRTMPNNWISVYHTFAWTYNPVRQQCYMHKFTPQQPDLNFRNERVYAEMLTIFSYWLTRGVDGFRVDAVNHLFETDSLPSQIYVNISLDRSRYDNQIHAHTMNRPESYQFIYDARELMDAFAESSDDKHTRLMMTEAYATIPQQVRWYGESPARKGAHMPFNFQLISDLDRSSNAFDFKRAIDGWVDAMPPWGTANWVLGNHDQSRLGSRYGEERHESLAIMSMMLPGLDVIYYGEEILMVDNMNISWEETDDPQARQTNETVFMQHSRDPARTPFQWDDTDFAGFSNTTVGTWLPIHANYRQRNLRAQKADPGSTYNLYKRMIALRKASEVLAIGEYESRAVTNTLFGFVRVLLHHETIAVFINLGPATTASLSDLLDDEEYDDWNRVQARVILVNNNSPLVVGHNVNINNIAIGAFEALVLEVSSAKSLAVSMLLIICALVKFIF